MHLLIVFGIILVVGVVLYIFTGPVGLYVAGLALVGIVVAAVGLVIGLIIKVFKNRR